jgi:hypothetical protein
MVSGKYQVQPWLHTIIVSSLEYHSNVTYGKVMGWKYDIWLYDNLDLMEM